MLTSYAMKLAIVMRDKRLESAYSSTPNPTLRPLFATLLVTLSISCPASPAGAQPPVLSESLLRQVDTRFSRDASNRLLIWQQLLHDMQPEAAGVLNHAPASTQVTLGKINTFFNQVPYYRDIVHWRVEDYWATPVEMLGSFGGDCEDYAVAKYLSLKDLGIPIDRLRITYVRALELNETHMVLAYYPTADSEPWILDNLIGEVRLASQRPDLEPVFSFNDDDMWLASGQSSKGGASNVRLWRTVQEKIRHEGSR